MPARFNCLILVKRKLNAGRLRFVDRCLLKGKRPRVSGCNEQSDADERGSSDRTVSFPGHSFRSLRASDIAVKSIVHDSECSRSFPEIHEIEMLGGPTTVLDKASSTPAARKKRLDAHGRFYRTSLPLAQSYTRVVARPLRLLTEFFGSSNRLDPTDRMKRTRKGAGLSLFCSPPFCAVNHRPSSFPWAGSLEGTTLKRFPSKVRRFFILVFFSPGFSGTL